MKLSALATLLPLLLSSTVAYATTDVCAVVNTDLRVPVGDKDVTGHIDTCLCGSQVSDFLDNNQLANEVVQGLGRDDARTYFTNFIKDQENKQECNYPTYAVPSCKADRLCDFTCQEGYTPSPSNSPTSCVPSRKRVVPNDGNGHDCVDIKTDVENCGACTVASPFGNKVTGKNCKAIPDVNEVVCDKGTCNVLSCKNGFEVSRSHDSCVKPRLNRVRDVAGEGIIDKILGSLESLHLLAPGIDIASLKEQLLAHVQKFDLHDILQTLISEGAIIIDDIEKLEEILGSVVKAH